MQRTKTVKFSDREVEVKELKVRDIWDKIGKTDSQTDIKAEAEDLLKKCVGLVLEDLQDLYPSEVQELWAAIREVNEGFFVAAEAMNLGEQARNIIRSAAGDLKAQSSG
jgi:head-tail adaptor